jgi:serine/threonine-protein kinase
VSTVDEMIGHILDGRYKVLEPISEGAMGIVYRGERLKLGRPVAIKVLRDELPNELASRKRFEVEAMAMAKLEHPHCVSVLDVGLHEDKPYVVMDFVSGTNLREILDREGALDIARAAEIMRQVLSGLAHAHELGIMHRDIKPANIMLSHKTGIGDQVKILDFGLARPLDGESNLTGTMMVLGTPAYMAPEQCSGGAIDARTDLYACGVLLFELVTGSKPFHSEKDDPIEIVRMHLDKPAPRLDAIAPGRPYGELEAVVARALAKAPIDRYQSAGELSAAIMAAAGLRDTKPATKPPVDDLSWAMPATAATRKVVESKPDRTPRKPAAKSDRTPPKPADAKPPLDHTPPKPADAKAPLAVEAFTPAEPAPEPDARVDLSWGLPKPEAPAVDAAVPISDPVAQISAPRDLKLPPRRPRRLYAIAGAIVLVIIVIAIVASSGGGPSAASATQAPSRDTTAADAATTTAVIAPSDVPPAPVTPPPEDGPDKVIFDANQLVKAGKLDAALATLREGHKAYYANPDIPLLSGRLYFTKHSWFEGMTALREAFRLDDSQRTPAIAELVVTSFLTLPERNASLATFIHDDLGRVAIPVLDNASSTGATAAIRQRAAAERARFKN